MRQRPLPLSPDKETCPLEQERTFTLHTWENESSVRLHWAVEVTESPCKCAPGPSFRLLTKSLSPGTSLLPVQWLCHLPASNLILDLQPPEQWEINFRCWSPPDCGILLWQTYTEGNELSWAVFQKGWPMEHEHQHSSLCLSQITSVPIYLSFLMVFSLKKK